MLNSLTARWVAEWYTCIIIRTMIGSLLLKISSKAQCSVVYSIIKDYGPETVLYSIWAIPLLVSLCIVIIASFGYCCFNILNNSLTSLFLQGFGSSYLNTIEYSNFLTFFLHLNLYGMENSIPVQIKQFSQPPAETIQPGNMVVTLIWQWLQSHFIL